MKHSHGFKIILTAMLAAMVCVCTICIQIPSPMSGYINLGDAMVLMSAFMLGPVFGAAAAGIGSGLADVLTGYVYYAPGTLVIKAAVALIAALCIRPLDRRSTPAAPLRFALAALPGEIIMVLGYLAYAWIFLGHGPAAAASVPGNLAQAAAGIAIAAILTPLVLKPREVQEMLKPFHK